ncbi:MAG TPA: phosphoglycerate mutase, partial [bacterium]|nr:phosphoglycerate mutase [bacterium]
MRQIDLLSSLADESGTRILMVVMDGLGGLDFDGRGTALDVANIPNMDVLASESACGLFDPVRPGITPGSGPGHLSLFGYDPLEFEIGRGILSALGVAFPVVAGDLATTGKATP